jgi:DNA repair protein RecO (recombination protein O)
MLVKTEGIVLQNIKYADKKIISRIYTRHYGLLTTHAVIGNSPQSKIKSATILPLHQIEISLTLKQNREVQQLIEARSLCVYNNLSRDYGKLAISQFLNEALCKCLKEQTANEELFNFISEAYKWLDEQEKNFSDFHIYFLFELSRFLGFEPHNNYTPETIYFNTQEGKFTALPVSFPMGLDKQQSELFLNLFDGGLMEKKFNKTERAELLECLLAYYKMQVAGFNELKSMAVFKEMFAS